MLKTGIEGWNEPLDLLYRRAHPVILIGDFASWHTPRVSSLPRSSPPVGRDQVEHRLQLFGDTFPLG